MSAEQRDSPEFDVEIGEPSQRERHDPAASKRRHGGASFQPERRPQPQHLGHALQRQMGNAALAAAYAPEPATGSHVLDVVGRGGGQALPAPLQRDMEDRLGEDLSAVRVHQGGVAAASAESVDAQAYTSGNEVVLGSGVDLTNAAGQETLAHELTHVVQQRSGPVAGTDNGDGLAVSDPNDRHEREATATAAAVMAAGPLGNTSSSSGTGGEA